MQHLWDAQRVAGLLWDQWVPDNACRVIEGSLPATARDGRALVCWLAGVHDVGKSSPSFSMQVPHLADRIRERGAAFPADSKDRRDTPHATVGQIALEDWLKARYDAPVRTRKSISAAVGAHHGKAPTSSQMDCARRRRDLRGEGVWHRVREEILDEMTDATGAAALLPAWLSHGGLAPEAQLLATAVVIIADWIASDESRFGYRSTFTGDPARADQAWAALELPPRWLPAWEPRQLSISELLVDRFPSLQGRDPRPVQAACVEAARSSDGPCLLVVEAPMGVGKTEGALLAAEELARRHGLNGVFVGLPTMATSDAMFDRVLPWIDRLPGDNPVSTFLAHSRAGLNTSYAGLKAASHPAYDDVGVAIAGVWDHESGAMDDTTPRAEAVAASWLSGRKRGALSSFVVGTIDQALFSALQAKHLMLRHLAMAGKVVVIDEVHAADDYMRVYLARALEWFAAYGVPVVLLSATLPSTQRAELVRAYQQGLGITGPSVEPVTAYPAITTATRHDVEVIAPEDDGRHVEVSMRLLDESTRDLVSVLRDALAEGGCAAVLRNTVARAQETYRQLVEEYGPESVTLVHSQLVGPERARREAGLREKLGPPGPTAGRPHRHVVVGTQVLEQSLDVDFDVMVSDIAPLDLVLQRVGRLHRHERAGRPTAVARPVCHVAGVGLTEGSGPTFDAGSEAVYGRSRLLRSVIGLDLHDGEPTSVRLPDDIRPRVERAYADGCRPPATWSDDLTGSDEEHRRQVAEAKGRASVYRLSAPPAHGYALWEFLTEPIEAAEDRAGGASVRDGDGSIDVILVREIEGQWRLLPGDFPLAGEVVPGELETPAPYLARAVAASTLRLPHRMCRPWVIDHVIDDLERRGFASWQHSPWLQGQLVLPLDADLHAEVAGFDLTYDPDLGLLVSREGATS